MLCELIKEKECCKNKTMEINWELLRQNSQNNEKFIIELLGQLILPDLIKFSKNVRSNR